MGGHGSSDMLLARVVTTLSYEERGYLLAKADVMEERALHDKSDTER
jgi:hypothetical protein